MCVYVYLQFNTLMQYLVGAIVYRKTNRIFLCQVVHYNCDYSCVIIIFPCGCLSEFLLSKSYFCGHCFVSIFCLCSVIPVDNTVLCIRCHCILIVS